MTWCRVPIWKVAEVESGFGFPRQYQGVQEAEYHFYKVGDMNHPENGTEMRVAANTISEATLKELRAKVFPAGTVIFPKIGAAIATNKKRILSRPAVVDNNVMGLIPKKDIEPWYLYYWTQHFDLRKVANIGPVPSMRKSEVEQIEIPVPPPKEQRRIVEILDQADALRKKRAEADARSARILPALFYKMFGDPAVNPKGWLTASLGEVTIGKPQYGANARAIEWSKGKPRYVRITDITEDGSLLKTGIMSLDLDDWQPYRLVPGDLLFARSGNTVGKTYLYQEEDGLCAYAGYLIRFKPNRDIVEPWYLFALTQTDFYRGWVETRKRVAGQPNINGQEYSSFRFPCPPPPLQQRFARLLKDVIVNRERSCTATEQISELFKVLLHRSFTGDLTAKWREAHMKELLTEMEEQAKALAVE